MSPQLSGSLGSAPWRSNVATVLLSLWWIALCRAEQGTVDSDDEGGYAIGHVMLTDGLAWAVAGRHTEEHAACIIAPELWSSRSASHKFICQLRAH